MKPTQHFRLLAIFALTIFLAASCKKKHDHDEDPAKAIITIDSPIDAHEYNKGDTVWMQGSISAPSDMHGFELKLTRLADDSTILSKGDHGHNSSYTFKEYWVNDGAVHSDFRFEVTAIVDHSNTTVTKSVNFHCHTQ